MKNKIIALTKSFENENIRTAWNKEEEKYYISIIDVVKVLTESQNPRKYWSVLKIRLKKEGSELATNCSQLKLKASDGKYYNTDVVDIEGMFRLIESIPSKNVEPIKLWLAHLGKDRIDEEFDSEITINRALETYRKKGYSTDELKNNGIKSGKDFAILTDTLTKIWSNHSIKEYKQLKRLKKENLRDNMTNMELVLNMLAEVTSTEISKSSDIKDKENAKKSIVEGGLITKNTREQIEVKTGKKIVTSKNNRNIKRIDNK